MTFAGVFFTIVILFLIWLWNTSVFWLVVVIGILGLLNISLTVAFYSFVGLAAAAGIWQFIDRRKHPEKWAEIDRKEKERKIEKEENERPEVAKNYWEQYQYATRRYPKSEWILMNRAEKSAVFESRERLKGDFYRLPLKTQKLIKNNYPIDTNFPHSG